MEDEFNVDNKYLHQETDSRKFRLTYLCNSKEHYATLTAWTEMLLFYPLETYRRWNPDIV